MLNNKNEFIELVEKWKFCWMKNNLHELAWLFLKENKQIGNFCIGFLFDCKCYYKKQ